MKTLKRFYLAVCAFVALSFPFLAAYLVDVVGKEIVVDLYTKAFVASIIFFIVMGILLLLEKSNSILIETFTSFLKSDKSKKETCDGENRSFFVILIDSIIISIAFFAHIFGFMTFIAAIAYAFISIQTATLLLLLGIYFTGVAVAAYDLAQEIEKSTIKENKKDQS